MEIKYIDGGVTAPKGFLASGIYCGIKQGSVKKDLALIYSEVPAKASGMFTKIKLKELLFISAKITYLTKKLKQ